MKYTAPVRRGFGRISSILINNFLQADAEGNPIRPSNINPQSWKDTLKALEWMQIESESQAAKDSIEPSVAEPAAESNPQ